MGYKRIVPTTLEEDMKALGILNEDESVETSADLQESSDETVDEAVKMVKKKIVTPGMRKKKRESKKYRRKNKSKLAKASKKFRKSSAGKRFQKKYSAYKKKHGAPKKGKRISVSGSDAYAGLGARIEALDSLSNSLFESDNPVQRVSDKINTILSIMEERMTWIYENVDETFEEHVYLVLEEIELLQKSLMAVATLEDEEAVSEEMQDIVEGLSFVLSAYESITGDEESGESDEYDEELDIEIDEEDDDPDDDADDGADADDDDDDDDEDEDEDEESDDE